MLTAILAGVLAISFSAFAKPAPKRDQRSIEEATRLQVFLDRADFGPGKIDGHYGDFTLKALALYREANGGAGQSNENTVEKMPAASAKERGKGKGSKPSEKAPDVSDLDLSGVEPVFIDYTVTEQDTRAVGKVPSDRAAQSKAKSLPYSSVTEAVAEKYHCDLKFFEELNPGKTKEMKPGDVVKVPNVEPFELAELKDLQPGKAANEEESSESARGSEKAKGKKKKSAEDTKESGSDLVIHISTKSNMLEVRSGEKLKAAFPVTVGSQETKSPIGDWKVQRITKMPTFRYDPQMLKHGERSSNFYLLPPGPNNPVGILWIALNKKGIGIHGTDSPDTIGRSASHGCIRLANWDVTKLATMVSPGVKVVID